MFLEDFGHKGPDAPPGGSVRVDGSREASGNTFVRVDHRAAVRNGEPVGNLFSNRCARLAERIRESAGVTTGNATSAQRAATGTPWLGLLLWFFACAALFLSLMMRPDGYNRDHRVASGGPAQPPIAGYAFPVPALTEHASEVRSVVSPGLPPRWAAD